MAGTVIERRFWNRVPRTQTHKPETIIVARTSLDALTEAVENARNRVVTIEAELHKAQNAYADAQRCWADAVLERGTDLGIPEFCKISATRKRPPPHTTAHFED